MEKAARYWRDLGNDLLECYLCPHHCHFREGQYGFCRSRVRQGNQLLLTNYGLTSGACIDPIEKKPLYHFLPGTPIFSFGTIGCNLACQFCQNWNISRAKDFGDGGISASPEAIVRTAKKMGCKSIAFTYNEPIISLEYTVDIAKLCHQEGIKTVAVTAGYIEPEARAEFFGHMDAANVDLKSFSENFYKKVCGVKLQPILDTLVYIKNETKVWLELTNLLIPGENDGDAELTAMAAWIAKNLGLDVPLHITAFHPDYKMTDKSSTSLEGLKRARSIAAAQGLHYVFTGNVHDPNGSTTACHNCGNVLIRRDGFEVSDWHLNSQAQCEYCRTPCAGVFAKNPGSWGARCVRVNNIGL